MLAAVQILGRAKAALESSNFPTVLTFHRFHKSSLGLDGVSDSELDIVTPGKGVPPPPAVIAPFKPKRGRPKTSLPAPPQPALMFVPRPGPDSNDASKGVSTPGTPSYMSPELLRPVDRSQLDAYVHKIRRPDGVVNPEDRPQEGRAGDGSDAQGKSGDVLQEFQPGFNATAVETAGKAVVQATMTPGVPTASSRTPSLVALRARARVCVCVTVGGSLRCCRRHGECGCEEGHRG